MTMKYQASFVRLARECALVDANMVMKVGVEGRVVLGPAGSPGPVGVPLRFAVVQETASGGMRAITTKFITVPVDVGATGNTPFVYVEEALSFPLPTPTTALDDYIVYVGFDPVSAEAQSKSGPIGTQISTQGAAEGQAERQFERQAKRRAERARANSGRRQLAKSNGALLPVLMC